VFIENDVIIGDNVTIKSGVQIWDGLRIGNNVFIGPNVTFTNDRVPRSKEYPEIFLKTIIEDGATIGANATILAGLRIGYKALIGAGSVITKNIPAYTVWYGNPAIHKGYISESNILLNKDLNSKDGVRFELLNGVPKPIK
jgi:acetyltransferase-like isoleucine patch superfamily enzyme